MLAGRVASSLKRTIVACYESESSISSASRKYGLIRKTRLPSLNSNSVPVSNTSPSPNGSVALNLRRGSGGMNENEIDNGHGEKNNINSQNLQSAAASAMMNASSSLYDTNADIVAAAAAVTASKNALEDRYMKSPGRLGPIGGGANTAATKNFLAVWQDHVSQAVKLIELEVAPTAIAFGVLEGRGRDEICVLGLADGTVLVCMLPFPTILVGLNAVISTMVSASNSNVLQLDQDDDQSVESVSKVATALDSPTFLNKAKRGRARSPTGHHQTNAIEKDKKNVIMNEVRNVHRNSLKTVSQPETLDFSQCKIHHLHEGPVTKICIAQSGLWMLSAGSDGSMFLLTTQSPKATDSHEPPESIAEENNIIQTGKSELKTHKSRIEDLEMTVEDIKREKERSIQTLLEGKKKAIEELESTKKREIEKRDRIIISGNAHYI